MRPALFAKLMSAIRGVAWTIGIIGGISSAQAADSSFSNRTLDTGTVRIIADRIEVKGSDLAKDALERLFDPASTEAWGARLARFSASRVEIPKLTLEWKMLGQTFSWSYRAVALADIRSGMIGEFTSQDGGGSHRDPLIGDITYAWREARISRLDTAGLASALTATRAAGEPQRFRELMGTARVTGFVQKHGANFTATQELNEWRDFAFSPGLKPLSERIGLVGEWLAKSAEAEKAGGQPPEPSPAAMADMLSIVEDIRFGTSAVEGMKMTFAADKANGIEEAGEITIRKLAMSDTGDVAANLTSVEGLAGIFGDARFSFQRMSFSGFSFVPALAALRADLASGKAEPSVEAIARYVPKLGRITLSGLDIEAPDKAKNRPGSPPPAPTRISLGEFDMDVRAQENGWPTDFRLAIERISAPVPRDDPSSKQLLDLGYTQLEMSSRIDLGWNRERSEIVVREIGLDGRDMLKLNIAGTIGNAGKDLFAPDMALAQVAALGLTVKTLQTRLENLGIFDRFLEFEARKARKEASALRREWGSLATIVMPVMLGDSPAAKAISSAVSRFIAKPGTLSVSANAPAGGIGLADVIATGDPKAILGKIDLKADAQ
ncbi:MAG: hypothetical protein ACRCWO_04105 [Bosea sp. (in: a-proteobacteria)]